MINNKLLKSAAAGAITPSDNFSVDTWTGDNTNPRTITTGIANDLVWIKTRNQSNSHNLFDSVRGAGNFLRSDSANAEGSASDLLKSFTSTGFTIGNGGDTNGNSNLYVAWSFKANGAAVQNNDGTITGANCLVSANKPAGFSIIKYAAASGTLGHGLDQTPEIIIQKKTSGSEDWYVYFPPTVIDSNYNYMVLNSAAGIATTSSTAPTATTFNPVSTSGNYIAYAFHSVAGYSKIDSYDGNGSTTGPYVETGFEPSFLLVKSTASTNWRIVDNKRSPSNPRRKALFPNLSNAEDDHESQEVNFFTTGFQIANNDGSWNTNNQKYIYMAFAADPDTTTPTLSPSFDVTTYTGNGGYLSIGSRFGKSANFNGSNSTIAAPNLGITGDPNITVSFWVNPNVVSSGVLNTPFFLGTASTGQAFVTFITAAYALDIGRWGDSIVTTDAGTVPQNKWTHIAITSAAGGSGVIYLDGAVAKTFDTTYNISTGGTFIGYASAGNQHFNGGIDQVRVYNSVLSASEVASLYNDETTTTVATLSFPSGKTATATYRLDGDGNDVGNNYNATTVSNVQFLSTKFKPDFVWIKSRSEAGHHALFDTLRGTSMVLASNQAGAEINRQSNQAGLSAFQNFGFTVNDPGGSGENYYVNQSGVTYVAWSWKMLDNNNDNPVLNEVGTIDSLVSVNSLAGQSITTYTGNGTQNATVGNGFNTQAKLVIIKNRDQGDAWFVGSPELGTNQFMELNLTTAKTTHSDLNYTINSTTMQFTSASPHHMFNASGERYVMYSFANITGYSHIGTYDGTDNATTAITGVGFKPDLVVIKCHNNSGQWNVLDSVRGVTHPLEWNQDSAEQTRSDFLVSFDTDGFTVAGDDAVSDNGRSFLYIAFKIN